MGPNPQDACREGFRVLKPGQQAWSCSASGAPAGLRVALLPREPQGSSQQALGVLTPVQRMGFSCLWLLAGAPSCPDPVATGLVLTGSGEKAFLSQPQVAAEASVRPSLYPGIVMQNPGPDPIPGVSCRCVWRLGVGAGSFPAGQHSSAPAGARLPSWSSGELV